MKLIDLLLQLIRYDLIAAFRSKANWINALLFFVIVISLFPLALSNDQSLLHTVGPGIIWIAALLSLTLSLPFFLKPDYEDGSLIGLLLSPYPLPCLLFAKVVAHWLITAMPLILLTPFFALAFHLSAQEALVLIFGLLLGTPVLSWLGAIMMGLTVSVAGNNLLLNLLMLPLCIPVLIFGTGAVMNVAMGVSGAGPLLFLAALCVLMMTLGPFLVAGALRIGE